MLTRKEILALNFIFKRLKGEQFNRTYDALQAINHILPKNVSAVDRWNLALLYHYNWEPQVKFEDVKTPIRFDPHIFGQLHTNLIALMLFKNDYNFENYRGVEDEYGYEHNGKKYLILPGDEDSYTFGGELIDYIRQTKEDDICRDYDIIKDYVKYPYHQIETVSRQMAEKDVKNMDLGEEILKLIKVVDTLQDRINKREDIIIPLYDKIEEAEKEFDDELVNKLENKMKVLFDEIDEINGKIGDIEEKIWDLEEDEAEGLIEDLATKYSIEIEDDPIKFFVYDKKIITYEDFINQFIDCEKAIEDFVSLSTKKALEYIGFEPTAKIRAENKLYTILEEI